MPAPDHRPLSPSLLVPMHRGVPAGGLANPQRKRAYTARLCALLEKLPMSAIQSHLKRIGAGRRIQDRITATTKEPQP